MQHIAVVGAGFGGLSAARALNNRPDVRVTLIDRRNHHLFQPLLYQVALAALSPADIAIPIRSILAGTRNIQVLLGNVKEIDFPGRRLQGDFGSLAYDSLVLACGCANGYFGHDDWEEHAPGLKSLEEATEMRRRVLMAFEMAERESDPAVQAELLSIVIIGAGPTGVELAGAVAEIARFTLERDFRRIDPRQCRVHLIEGGPRILPAFDPVLSQAAQRSLERLGVTVRTSTRVTGLGREFVELGSEIIRARTILWAAGIEPTSLSKRLAVSKDGTGRIVVQPDLSLSNHPEVFVIGDQASFSQDGKVLPGLSPVAIQQGRHVVRCIEADLRGRPRPEFRYLDKGIMATIGRAAAIAQRGPIKLSGFVAWLGWLLVHIFFLIGFRNRTSVFLQWAWSYLTFRRGARLITSRHWQRKKRNRLSERYSEITGLEPEDRSH